MKTWKKIAFAAAMPLCVLTACVDDSKVSGTTDKAVEGFDFIAMAANYADNVILPVYSNFSASIDVMAASDGALASYCAAIGSADEASQLALAQAAWRETAGVWQQAELMQIGPLTDNSYALKNRIYAYSDSLVLSTCAVDDNVVQAAENTAFDLSVRAANSKGLGALEYLLFNDSLEHTCPSQIVSTQTWNERTEQERKSLRCAYAQDLAADISLATNTLVDSWASDGQNYRSVFLNPANVQSQVSALSDAMFYIESEAKDFKLGATLGLHASCSQSSCPENVESKWSQISLENIRNNLLAFQNLLMGGDGLGFDDLIAIQGVESIVEDFNQNISAAIALIDAADTSLYATSQAILDNDTSALCDNSAANPSAAAESIDACRLHGYLKNITDILRAEFVAAINVDIPARVGGDTD